MRMSKEEKEEYIEPQPKTINNQKINRYDIHIL